MNGASRLLPAETSAKMFVHLILLLGIVVTVFPFLWMILTSFKSLSESLQIPPAMLPKTVNFDNYSSALNILSFKYFYRNTIVSTAFITLGQVLICSLAAYAFACIDFPFKNFIFFMILSVLMVPSQIFLLPQFIIIAKMKLLNTITALIVPNLFNAFGTFLLRQFFATIPKDLREMARIDGCNHFTVYSKIVLPLATSGLAALSIFTVLFAWNNLMWPLIVNGSTSKMTLSVGLATMIGQHTVDYPQLMAGSVMAIWPMILLFIIFQKQFIKGIAMTGLKA